MQRVKLTAERIRKFECPPDKQQAFLWDTESRLAVRATAGAKSYIYQGKLKGQTIRWTIGDVSDWLLESRDPTNPGAREEARRLQTLIDKGIDPRELRREQEAARADRKAAEAAARVETEERKKYTLQALCEAYVGTLEAAGKSGASDARSLFKCHVYTVPEIAGKPASEVEDEEIAEIISRVFEAGKERAAGKLRSYLRRAYQIAITSRLDPKQPSSLKAFRLRVNPVAAIPTIPGKARTRTLSEKELKAYVEALGDDIIDTALRVALLAGGQRMKQLLRAGPADWNGEHLRLFDPKGRRLTPREHLIPLGPKAAAMVSDLAEKAQGRGSQYLFSSFGRVPLSAFTVSKRVNEIRTAMKCEPFDLRDIRRTCETMLVGKAGISRDVRAQLLSHGISGVQAVHYDRHDYIAEKAAALKKWEKKLDEIVSGKKPGKVVALR